MGQATFNPEKAELNKQDRKLQNRRNQRARRQRLKGKDAEVGQDILPFEVRRWRLDEIDSSSQDTNVDMTMCKSRPPHLTVPATAEEATLFPTSQTTAHLDQVVTTGSTPQPIDFAFPLPSDHLLHLIQYNVFRAFISIKRILNTVSPDPMTCPVFGPCLDDTMRRPPNPNIPPSLAPTTLQLTRYHFPWINSFPFPGVRDNLIRREGRFDNWELWQDLVGNLMSPTRAAWQRETPDGTCAHVLGLEQTQVRLSGSYVDTDEVTTGRNGLIIWGEPHDMQSWEATPGFLAKWSWAVEGCDGLVESSNRWRMRRGEDPMGVAI
ncbi:Ff.00g035600.m01.CDS01 [Fusarium sp. VM40]|nr:Ff.00g035600.m01.CDS01 [Fusarium sp. VM40]